MNKMNFWKIVWACYSVILLFVSGFFLFACGIYIASYFLLACIIRGTMKILKGIRVVKRFNKFLEDLTDAIFKKQAEKDD